MSWSSWRPRNKKEIRRDPCKKWLTIRRRGKMWQILTGQIIMETIQMIDMMSMKEVLGRIKSHHCLKSKDQSTFTKITSATLEKKQCHWTQILPKRKMIRCTKTYTTKSWAQLPKNTDCSNPLKTTSTSTNLVGTQCKTKMITNIKNNWGMLMLINR